ncbi:MAG: glycosyltransferase family 2 protein [Chloroflexota bacterium]
MQSNVVYPFIGEIGEQPALPKVSVVIPTLNESRNLPFVLPRIPSWVHEVIIVDGRSEDDTIEVARKLLHNVRIVLEKKKGKGVALRTGFAAATGDVIVMLDADGSMAPEEIPLYVGAIMAGADFVKGSRFLQGGGTDDMEIHRMLGNWGLMIVARVLFGGHYSDLCYGYSAFTKEAIERLELKGDGFEIETEMNVRALQVGLKIAEVPSFEFDREYGTSNLNAIRDGLRIVRTMFNEFFGIGREKSGVNLPQAQQEQLAEEITSTPRSRAHSLYEPSRSVKQAQAQTQTTGAV